MATYRVNNNLDKNIFRAYDIRGIVGIGIDADTFYTLGLVLSSEILANNEDTVIVGRDGRLSSPELSEALIQGLCDGGCNVNFIGEVPSPVLYFSTYKLGIKSGLMLTGSHNPKNYNGLKMMLSGKTLSEGAIQDLYNKSLLQQQPSGPKGSIKEVSVNELYQDDIINRVQLSRRLKVVVDCGNGVAGNIAPGLFKALGCDVISLYCDVDGNFPNHHPNPSVEENLIDLKNAVATHNADIGLAFDGDADRLGVVANNGKVIWPDRLMMLYSQEILKNHAGGSIVFDVKCSSFLNDVIKNAGGNPIQWRTGHSVLKAKMIEENAVIAGEMSGHIFFKDNWYGFDDGIYSGVRLLEILSMRQESCADIFSKLPEGINTPEILIPIADNDKFNFMNNLSVAANFSDATVNRIDGIRVNFADGWGLVRASNTTPALTLRFEALTETRLQDIKTKICDLMLSIDPLLDLSEAQC
jgi:phosphomannomutase/phosphoglucomutase